jgi:hypothetical protein
MDNSIIIETKKKKLGRPYKYTNVNLSDEELLKILLEKKEQLNKLSMESYYRCKLKKTNQIRFTDKKNIGRPRLSDEQKKANLENKLKEKLNDDNIIEKKKVGRKPKTINLDNIAEHLKIKIYIE